MMKNYVNERKTQRLLQIIVNMVVAFFCAIPTLAAKEFRLPRSTIKPIEDYRMFLRDTRGAWLNVPFSNEVDPDVRAFEAKIYALIRQFRAKEPHLADIPIRFNLYKNDVPNAWVWRQRRNGRGVPQSIPEVMRLFGYDAEKGFIELGVTTGLLEIIDNFDQLAFIIGHEMGHILEGHLKDASEFSVDDVIRGWWDGQTREFGPDARGLELNAGIANLDAAVDVMWKLFERFQMSHERRDSLAERSLQLIRSVKSTHPHEGLRLSILEAYSRFLKGKTANGEKAPQELSPEICRLAKKYATEKNLSSDEQEYIALLFNEEKKSDWPFVRDIIYTFSTAKKAKLLDDLPHYLDSLSSDPAAKLRVALTVVHALAMGGSRGLSEQTIAMIEGVNLRPALASWLKDTQPEILPKVMSHVASPQIHRVLMALSYGAGQVSGRLSQLDQFFLRFFDGKFEKLIMSSTSSLGLNLGKKAAPGLKLEVARKALSTIKTLSFETMAEKVSNLEGRSVYTGEKEVAPTEIEVFNNSVEFLASAMKVPEVAPLKLEMKMACHRLQDEIYKKKFANFVFPKAMSISVERRENEGSIYSDFIPPFSNVFDQPPFTVLQWLRLIGPRNFDLFAPRLMGFYEEILLGSLRVDLQGKLQNTDTHSHRIDYLIDGMQRSSHRSHDVVLAKLWLKYESQLPTPAKAEFMHTWMRLRFLHSFEKPQLPAELAERLDKSIQRLSTVDLQVFMNYPGNLPFLANFRVTPRLFAAAGTLQIGQVFRRVRGTALLIEDALRVLSEREAQTTGDAKTWLNALESILGKSDFSTQFNKELSLKIERTTAKHLALLERSDRVSMLRKENIRNALGAEMAALLLKHEFVERTGKKITFEGDALKVELQNFEKELGLEKTSSLTAQYRDLVARDLRIQPHQINLINPRTGETITSLSAGSGEMVRGFSGLLDLMRSFTQKEQIEFVRYLCGQTRQIPVAIVQLEDQIKKSGSRVTKDLSTMVIAARRKMDELDEVSRALVVHSFFTGPSGVLAKGDGLAEIEGLILRSVPPENAEITRKIMHAIRKAEGRHYGLLLSYALAQKPGSGSGVLTEASILKALLESYGVPGMKFGQFLAFSSSFSKYRSTFELFQDAAMPISYISMLNLLESHLGVEWDPLRFEVIDMKGSGSVNIAIEVFDRKSKRTRIINVLREDIENRARYDFDRFKRMVSELKKLTSEKDTIGSLGGLAELVEDSVIAEFDKAHARKMHDQAEALYSGKVGEWTVRAVRVAEVMGRALNMEVAEGISARRALNENPEAYRQGMRAFLTLAEERIRGVGPDGQWATLIITDPDIHNGQFFIDAASKTITLIDKGQASEITLTQRELAVSLLRLAARVITVEDFARETAAYEGWTGLKLAERDLARIKDLMNRPDFMDRYLNLIGFFRENGKLPTAVVNYGFEFYRARELARQVDKNIEYRLNAQILGTVRAAAIRARSWFSASAEGRQIRAIRCEDLFGFLSGRL